MAARRFTPAPCRRFGQDSVGVGEVERGKVTALNGTSQVGTMYAALTGAAQVELQHCAVALCLPPVRQEVWDFTHACRRQALKHIGEVRKHIKLVTLGAHDHRVHDRRALAALVGSGKQPVLAANSDGPERSLCHVVVNGKPAMLDIAIERIPLRLGVVDGLSGWGLWQCNPLTLLEP